MYDLSGRVALVTGAGPNIGRVIAATLARAGACVLCNDLKPAIAEAAAKFAAEGARNAHALAFDITDPDAVDQAVEAASRQYGVIDILVNNAGVTVVRQFEICFL
jgi:NAD(P)-dependent dehydrogenase (short-subunit alcohol dehydrogenase family)